MKTTVLYIYIYINEDNAIWHIYYKALANVTYKVFSYTVHNDNTTGHKYIVMLDVHW